MIHRTQMSFLVTGDGFYPSRVTAPFSEATDPGEILRAGRNRGSPAVSGYASFHAPESVDGQISFLHRLVVPLIPALREAGAEQFTLLVTIHCDSSAIGFSREEIRMIAEMECDLPIDCLIEEEKAAEPGATDNPGGA